MVKSDPIPGGGEQNLVAPGGVHFLMTALVLKGEGQISAHDQGKFTVDGGVQPT